jgi:hypothetical protein
MVVVILSAIGMRKSSIRKGRSEVGVSGEKEK